MTTTHERTLGEPYEMPNYGDAATNAMWDMPWLWDEKEDPHPGLETLKKADTLTAPANTHAKQTKTGMPDTADLRITDPFKSTGLFGDPARDISRPSLNTHDGGLMSNFSTNSKGTLTGQAGASIRAGKNADGQRLTEKYEQLNPYRDQRLTQTDETLFNARKLTEAIVSPKMGDSPVRQGFSSAASNRHNEGLAYLPAMQRYVQKGHTEGIQASNEAEADFSYQVASRVADATKAAYSRNYESAARSIDGAEASYSKRYPENPQHYEKLLQRLADPGAKAVETLESFQEITDEEKNLFEHFQNGLGVSFLRNADISSGAMALADKLLPGKDGIVNDQQTFDKHIEENNLKQKIRERRANMISATQLKGKDPGETWQNIKRWCSETILGEYAIDLALILGTKGRAATPLRVMKAMNAVARFSDKNRQEQDAIENAEANRPLRFGEEESEAHARLNRMADVLDQNSSTAVKFLIKVMPDPMRKDFLDTYDGLRKDW